MSNNGLQSNATNGRNGAKGKVTSAAAASTTTTTATTMSISHKSEQRSKVTVTQNVKLGTTIITSTGPGPGQGTTTTTLTTTILPTTKLNSNDCKAPTPNVAATATHRRDNSSFGRGVIAGQIKRDQQRFHYGKPQRPPDKIEEKMSRVNSLKEDVIEPELDPKTLVYYDGNLIAGTLEALIEHMVPTSDYYPERTYVFAFLLSARLFIRPHELLAKVSHTWQCQQQEMAAAGVDVVDEAHFSHLTVAASASPLALRKNSDGPQTLVTKVSPSSSTVPDPAGAQKMPRTPMQKSAQNCIRLLAEWIETFPYDFRDERLMQQVRILARKCVYIDNSLGKQVSRILQLLVQRLTALEKYEEFLQALTTAELSASCHQGSNSTREQLHTSSLTSANAANTHQSQVQHNLLGRSIVSSLNSASDSTTTIHHKSGVIAAANYSNTNASNSTDSTSHDVFGIMDICSSCSQLAHQLTAIELERLSHIGPEEFVQSFVKDCQQTTTPQTGGGGSTTTSGSTSNHSSIMTNSLHDMKKTRNLESYVEWFNRLSYLTASEIVKYPKKKQRVRIIEYWIETARECFNLGNFNSLMAIIAGLNLEPISRLKKTWSKVQSAKFSVLEHQMDPTSNFNSYRSTLKAAMWRSEGATNERERIIIPFFSLFVKDLYFLNEGCSNRLPNNHINFEKCSQLAKQIMEFNEWKKVRCPFENLPNVIAYLQNIPVLNENTLSMASFECEPPENTEEKGRYKTVKAETKQQLLQQLQDQHQQQQQQH